VFEFITRLFKSRPSASQEVATAPLSEEQLASVSHLKKMYRPAQLHVGSAQSAGKQRDHNEDALFTLNMVLSEGNNEIPFGIFVIADGMGGHQHGEVASGMAVRAISDHILRKVFSPLFGVSKNGLPDSIQEVMEASFDEAQRAVIEKAPGGGTTLTAALVAGEQITLAHVGDSRAYFLTPDGRMDLLTNDHSLVHRLLELGQITPEEAAVHPQRNVLYRAIGQAEPIHPDIYHHPLPNPGYLLICSDGLWGVVSDEDISGIVRGAGNVSEACQRLVDAANQAGGPDNISVILVQYIS
jgi:serine/threonine protein phosphatase PrpC